MIIFTALAIIVGYILICAYMLVDTVDEYNDIVDHQERKHSK